MLTEIYARTLLQSFIDRFNLWTDLFLLCCCLTFKVNSLIYAFKVVYEDTALEMSDVESRGSKQYWTMLCMN